MINIVLRYVVQLLSMADLTGSELEMAHLEDHWFPNLLLFLGCKQAGQLGDMVSIQSSRFYQ